MDHVHVHVLSLTYWQTLIISYNFYSFSFSLSLYRYLVVKGTPQKMLEYLLTLDIAPGGRDAAIDGKRRTSCSLN